jgi:glycine cleavage system aminomethyltransferase T
MFMHAPSYPYDPNVGLYTMVMAPYLQALTFTGWQDETQSWKETCYIHAGLNLNPAFRINGPDAIRMLSELTFNSFANFPVGRIKHTGMCDDEGRVLCHGMVLRTGEQEIYVYTMGPWMQYASALAEYDVEFEEHTEDDFNFQCAGPRILEALEAATGEDLHDIPFMGFRSSSIDGRDVRIMRFGMGGTLAYEVHGDMKDACRLYEKVLEAGEPFGMRRIGWQAYSLNHPENGYAQEAYTFLGSSAEDKPFLEFLRSIGLDTTEWPEGATLCGSSGADRSKRWRNPFELGWGHMVTFDHEFRGKAALEKVAASPHRQCVDLIWNVEDIMEVYASMFQKDEPTYPYMEIPQEPIFLTTTGGVRFYQDDVFKDGKLVGFCTGRTYSLHSRDMFSTGFVDAEYAEVGTELQVLYGEEGTRQKLIRVTVAPYPHLSHSMTMNKDYDVESIPRPTKA